jgi:Spy/CpxP family protein refolding chaperone
MNKPYPLIRFVLIPFLFLLFATPLIARPIVGIQMAELTKKLHLTDQQQKELAPVVEQRDKEAAALKANTSLSKIQKLRRLSEIQRNFRNNAAKILNPEQIKKLDAIQAERRAELTGHS